MPNQRSSSRLFNASGAVTARLAAVRNRTERAGAAIRRTTLTLSSNSVRHGIRFGAALAAGVAAYRILGFHQHGYWIPLTILCW